MTHRRPIDAADVQTNPFRQNAGLLAGLVVAGGVALGLGVWIPSSALRHLEAPAERAPGIGRAQLEALQRERLCRGSNVGRYVKTKDAP